MYIVTDLTRFGPGNPKVCTALINMDTGRCVRPMPYFGYELVRKYGVIPGAIFSGNFSPKKASVPHTEDCDFENLEFHGPAKKAQFRRVLESSLHGSVSDGFDINLGVGQKVIPPLHQGTRSIITLRVRAGDVEIHADGFNNKKIKISFIDSDGMSFRFMPVTDLGFHDYASTRLGPGDLDALNRHLQCSDEIFLRVGLSRIYTAPDGRSGYWIQVNGIYTFPSKLEVVRGYS